MKKLILIFIVSMMLTGYAFGQESANPQSCVDTYKGQVTKGYNALAMAIDNGFVVCGYAFGGYDKGYAARQALSECEQRRLDPANKVQGMRKIMTHCRVHEFLFIE